MNSWAGTSADACSAGYLGCSLARTVQSPISYIYIKKRAGFVPVTDRTSVKRGQARTTTSATIVSVGTSQHRHAWLNPTDSSKTRPPPRVYYPHIIGYSTTWFLFDRSIVNSTFHFSESIDSKFSFFFNVFLVWFQNILLWGVFFLVLPFPKFLFCSIILQYQCQCKKKLQESRSE